MKLNDITEVIVAKRRSTASTQSLLVGISGIDASGKGFVAAKLTELLKHKGFSVALINVDGWLNLPHVRFSDKDQGLHFYKNALRLDEMFERLILPLRQDRGVDITMDLAEETASAFRPHRYLFDDVDIILLEGIFIFRRQFVEHFDLKIWVDCTFDTAIERAIARSQEGLNEVETRTAYETIYFPAQAVHFELDAPKRAANFVFPND